MAVSQVQAGGSQEKQKEEVPQHIDANKVVGALLAGEVPLQQRELEITFTTSPWEESKRMDHW